MTCRPTRRTQKQTEFQLVRELRDSQLQRVRKIEPPQTLATLRDKIQGIGSKLLQTVRAPEKLRHFGVGNESLFPFLHPLLAELFALGAPQLGLCFQATAFGQEFAAVATAFFEIHRRGWGVCGSRVFVVLLSRPTIPTGHFPSTADRLELHKLPRRKISGTNLALITAPRLRFHRFLS